MLEVSHVALQTFLHPSPSQDVLQEFAHLLSCTIRRLLASRAKSVRRRAVIPGRTDVFRKLFGEQPPGRQLVPYSPAQFPLPYFRPSFYVYTSPTGSRFYADIALRSRLSSTPPSHYTSDSGEVVTTPYSVLYVESLSVRVDKKPLV